jgi:DNA modification methylase
MKTEAGRGWNLSNGDSCEWLQTLEPESIGYSVSSIPFSSLFAYSDSPNDLSNCDSHEQFFEHFSFIASGLFRALKPGRLVSTHVMTLPTSKTRDGHIGLYDFPGDTIRAFERAGFWYHSKTTIWKNPVQAMQRTKARGLLWKELRKDSAISRMGIADEVLTFRKPGENTEPITHSMDEFPVSQWQQWASPIWLDIDQGEVLPCRASKEEDDQKHLCPLQLEVIRRCVRLWSNPGDLVLTPFAGIGSELYVALQEGRRAIGCELKPSYFRQAVANLRAAEQAPGDLFKSLHGKSGGSDLLSAK